MTYSTLESFPKGKFCNFCKLTTVDPLGLGNIYQLGDIIVHYFCLLLASRGEQRGTDKQGILGFLLKDIKKEIYRGAHIKCVYCRKSGATVICSQVKCKLNFHLPCGQKNNSLHFFYKDFQSLCVHHRPKVIIPHKIIKSVVANKTDCVICFTPVDVRDKYNLIWSPCCCNPSSLQHRKCVQKMAFSAGYYFKCPFCANSKKYITKMQHFGIYVPEQEASWERDPHAFSELNVDMMCANKSCCCPYGPSYGRRSTKWQLQNCTLCGGNAIHLACSGKWKPQTRNYCIEWVCTECLEITKGVSVKDDTHETEIAPRFRIFGRFRTFLSSCTSWRESSEVQIKIPVDEQKSKTNLSLSRMSDSKIFMKKLVLFITDDLLMNGIHGLTGVEEIVVNNKRCSVLIKKLEFDEYKRYIKTVNYEQPTIKDDGGKMQCRIEDDQRLQRELDSTFLLPSESCKTDQSQCSIVLSHDEKKKSLYRNNKCIKRQRNVFFESNSGKEDLEISVGHIGDSNEDNRYVEEPSPSVSVELSSHHESIELNDNLKEKFLTSLENLCNQTKIWPTETNENKQIWNYAKITIPNLLTIEYKEFFKQFKDIVFLYNNKNRLKLTIRNQVRQFRHYKCKPYLRTTKTNLDVSSNFTLWKYFYQIGVIKKRTRLEILSFIDKCPCVIFTGSSGLIYADLVKSFLPQNWPVKIITERNCNMSDLIIKAYRLLMKASEKTAIILLSNTCICCDSLKEVMSLLEKITVNNNYSNLLISQIPATPANGRNQCKRDAQSNNKLLNFSRKFGCKVWDIENIFL